MALYKIRRKTYLFFLIACIGIVFVMFLYLGINLPPTVSLDSNRKTEKYMHIQARVEELENNINSNRVTVNKIKSLIDTISSDFDKSESKHTQRIEDDQNQVKGGLAIVKEGLKDADCSFSMSSPSEVDVRMKDVNDKLPFDNPDGGVWKQGWDIEYEPRQWNFNKKLKVFVVPHSHNDPGWLKTFEQYFEKQTNAILNNMVLKLKEYPKMKFIWAEISFFARWWERQSEASKDAVRTFINRGQLEIVSGGWVMPDEANSHYFSMLDQLFTGHEWLRKNLNTKPSNGWAIDPFGMSPTMAYILKRSGLKNMLVQRTHYAIKKHLARLQSLEFRWRQMWDRESSTDMLCHMMPFYGYDVPHTCGPDPKICCQFDFARLPGKSSYHCPWKVAPQMITKSNVGAKAEILLDQYRKKSELYKTDVVLAPLGDDFRYDTSFEWKDQYENYQKLFDYMNSNEELSVQIQFGTLADYFETLRTEASSSFAETAEEFFPSLSGDFFSYSDRNEDYWTGYFVTRPFYKRMDRVLQSYLRSAEILFSLFMDYASSQKVLESEISSLSDRLDLARQYHGLFQHHDGVTGTSKEHVVIDYANKMLQAIQNCQYVIEKTAYTLLSTSSASKIPSASSSLTVQQQFDSYKSIGIDNALMVDVSKPSVVYFYNSEAQKRTQLVTVTVNSPYVKVTDMNGKAVLCQVDPMFDGEVNEVFDKFEVHFLANLDPLSLTKFSVQQVPPEEIDSRWTTFADVVHNSLVSLSVRDVFRTTKNNGEKGFHLSVGHLSADFSENGLLRKLESQGHILDVNLKFIKYKAGEGGAYLFLPEGEAEILSITKSKVLVTQGPLKSTLNMFHDLNHLRHQVILRKSPGADGQGLQIINYFDIRDEGNRYQGLPNNEYGMRLNTGVRNGDVFYTDLNGFQVVKRIRYEKLPLQGRFYPMPTQMFIEDKKRRLSLLGAQPLGCSSLADGEMEVIFDRQLSKDDNRGLALSIQDNVYTRHAFTLLLEQKSSQVSAPKEDLAYGVPTLLSNAALTHLLHPSIVLHGDKLPDDLANHWSVGGELPCDVELINLRTTFEGWRKPEEAHVNLKPSVALTLHRRGYSCGFASTVLSCSLNKGEIRLSDLFPRVFGSSAQQMYISHLFEGNAISKTEAVQLKPMEIYSFRLTP